MVNVYDWTLNQNPFFVHRLNVYDANHCAFLYAKYVINMILMNIFNIFNIYNIILNTILINFNCPD